MATSKENLDNGVVAFYRLEFNDFTGNKNEEKISIDADGKVRFTTPLYISDYEHNQYFASIKKKHLNKAVKKNEDIYFAQKIVYFPRFVAELVQTFGVHQVFANDKKQLAFNFAWYMEKFDINEPNLKGFKSKKPKFVDESKGNAYQIETPWIKLLAETCLAYEVKECKSLEDYNNAFKNEEPTLKEVKNDNLDYSNKDFSKLFAQCVVGPVFASEKQELGIDKLIEILNDNNIVYDEKEIRAQHCELLNAAQERSNIK